MEGVGRKVFGEVNTSAWIIFEGAPEEKYENGSYAVTDGFLLPAGMVKQPFPPGGFVLTPDCCVIENTVLNERNEECIMIRHDDLQRGTKAELLIPRRILRKAVEPPRETYPSKWR